MTWTERDCCALTNAWGRPGYQNKNREKLRLRHTEGYSDIVSCRGSITPPYLYREKKNVLQYWCPKNLVTLLHYLYVRMLIPFSAALFIVGSYLCTINTRPTFSTAIKQNFRWKEIHSVQPGSRGPFHLTPHFSSRFCYHLTQWRASSFWRASCWNSICSLLEKSQFCSTAGPTRGFFVA